MSNALFTPAGQRHLSFIESAQDETANISFGRPLLATEQSGLRARLAAALSDPFSRVLVVEGPGGPEGYVWLEGRANGRAFLLDIFVEKNARRRGIGRKLLRQALESARELKQSELRLAVSSRNAAAEGLFRSEGFCETDTEIRDGVQWFEMGRSTNLS